MNTIQPLVSVIIPVYNKAEYIDECLSRIVHQTWKNLEIIVVDDDSVDGSFLRAQAVAREDGRIMLHHINHAGVSAARNRGMRLAHGEYIAFVDADDLIPHNYIEALLSAMSSADVCMCPMWKWNDSAGSVRTYACGAAEYTKPEFLQNKSGLWLLCSSACAKLFSASFLRGHHIAFDESVNYGEDTLFFFNCLLKAELIRSTDLTKYIYRVGIQSSLNDRNLTDLQLNKKLMAALHAFSRRSRDGLMNGLVSWKQLSFLYTIGRISCSLNDWKGAEFFSCAREYNLADCGQSGVALSRGEKLTTLTLRLRWFFPFYIITKVMFRSVGEKRSLFRRKARTRSDGSAVSDINRMIRSEGITEKRTGDE